MFLFHPENGRKNPHKTIDAIGLPIGKERHCLAGAGQVKTLPELLTGELWGGNGKNRPFHCFACVNCITLTSEKILSTETQGSCTA